MVNREKTRLTHVGEGVHFLGVVIRRGSTSVDPKRVERLKAKVRALTPRNHGGRVEDAVKALRRLLLGWYNYFKMANCKGLIEEFMGWIRRRLRMMQMREWKSWKPLHRALRQRGYHGEFEKGAALLVALTVAAWHRLSNWPEGRQARLVAKLRRCRRVLARIAA